MEILLVLAMLAHNPPATAVRDQFDLVELNHFYDENGRLAWDQLIFYDWIESKRRFQCEAWLLIKRPEQLPVRTANGYSMVYQDTETKTWRENDRTFMEVRSGMRHVEARWFRETWTQNDPELLEREHWPKERRRWFRSLFLDSRNQ